MHTVVELTPVRHHACTHIHTYVHTYVHTRVWPLRVPLAPGAECARWRCRRERVGACADAGPLEQGLQRRQEVDGVVARRAVQMMG
jgi:hypothetical protein